MSKFPYQIGLLGDYEKHEDNISISVENRFLELGFDCDDFKILSGSNVLNRERRAPFAALFFGYLGAESNTHPEIDDIVEDSVVIVPIVDNLQLFSQSVPSQLLNVNGIERNLADPKFERDVSTILENFRLLRKDRRLFISYKRSDSRRVAVQLYEALDRRGFDVFLDTHGVPAGEDFQSVLWHRLADSDVVVLLDTPNFYESRWTQEEVARANATNIQVLHLLWPDQPAPANSALSCFYTLNDGSFVGSTLGDDSLLLQSVVDALSVEVEALRARALAARHRYLVDAFCDEARRQGLDVSVQPTRHILMSGPKGIIDIVPVVGVPSAQRLHEVQMDLNSAGSIWALSDQRGLLKSTLDHLVWLNSSLPLQTVSVYEVVDRLGQQSKP